MNLREPLLKEKKYGESIEAVEELLRHHADFEKTVMAQEDRVKALSRNEKVRLLWVLRQGFCWLITGAMTKRMKLLLKSLLGVLLACPVLLIVCFETGDFQGFITSHFYEWGIGLGLHGRLVSTFDKLKMLNSV